jgi:hypothetical protein
MNDLATFYRNCAELGVVLTPHERRLMGAAAPAPALPRLPADLLRECERAAGIATTHNQENDA